MRRDAPVGSKTATAPVCCLCLLVMLVGKGAGQPKGGKTCPKVEVHSVAVSAEFGMFPASSTPEIETISPGAPPGALRTAPKAIELIALGPVLGSMDSPKIGTGLSCTAEGFELTAVITRFANCTGSAAKNVPWRPKIGMTVIPRGPGAVVKVVWRMRLTTGIEVHRSQTPGYQVQAYPVTVTRTIR